MAELLTLARPYAKAVFRLAQEKKQLEEWSEILNLFSYIVLNPKVKTLQGNPNISASDWVSLFKDVSQDKLSEPVVNFLQLLADNNRLNLLPDIFVLYEQHKAEALKHIEVEMISAFKVSDKQKQMFITALKAKLGKDINLQCKEDPTLVGGAIIRAGDKVIDGSVRGRLYQMAESLGA